MRKAPQSGIIRALSSREAIERAEAESTDEECMRRARMENTGMEHIRKAQQSDVSREHYRGTTLSQEHSSPTAAIVRSAHTTRDNTRERTLVCVVGAAAWVR